MLWGGYVLLYFLLLGAASMIAGTAAHPLEPALAMEAGVAMSPFIGIALASFMLWITPEQEV